MTECYACEHEWEVKPEDEYTGCTVTEGQYEEFEAATCPECGSEVRLYNY